MEGEPSWRMGRGADRAYLFVYGSLRRGGELHRHLATARYLGPAWTRGRIVQAGAYPGLVEGDDRVDGELYELSDPAVELEALDDVEGYVPEDALGSPYVRQLRSVFKDDGAEVRAWVYVWNAAAGA